MPPVPPGNIYSYRVLAARGLSLISLTKWSSRIFLFLVTVLLLLRTGMLVTLAVAHRLREGQGGPDLAFTPPVSVIICAFNEGLVIRQSLMAVLQSTYPGPLEVLVVNDGSTDNTGEILKEMAQKDTRVRIITHPNRGKAISLNQAFNEASHDILVTLDADTLCEPQSIGYLIAPLVDKKVGAVSGKVLVHNSKSVLGRMQSLEYLWGFNLDRRAHDLINGIVVVPGAAAAFRRSAVTHVGGISADTFAEDTDVTLALHAAGYTIRYAPKGIAWTDAPQTLSTFVRQRKRWSFGTLQCLWKHRGLVCKRDGGALSWFVLPSVLFCHVFVTALIPLVDIALLCSLTGGISRSLVAYSAAFLVVDLLIAFIACRIDREPTRQALWVLIMRIVYRPVLSFVIISSLLRALKGGWVGWGHQDRVGIKAKELVVT
jgi:poly-beta-1,6 N-acetyl-D-glucosamine synthase